MNCVWRSWLHAHKQCLKLRNIYNLLRCKSFPLTLARIWKWMLNINIHVWLSSLTTLHKMWLTPNLWPSLLKTDILKWQKHMIIWVLPFHVWHSVHVTSQSRLACMPDKIFYLMSQLFLLFIGKEQTNMAALRGTQIWRKQKTKKQYLCCINIDRATIQNLLMEIFAHFLYFQANLPHPLGSHVRWNSIYEHIVILKSPLCTVVILGGSPKISFW